MKLWTEPEIYVLAQPLEGYYPAWEWANDKQPGQAKNYPWRREKAPCELATSWKVPPFDGERLAEIAGRACYWSYGKGRKTNEDYIRHIVESGHGSVLEHPNWTFGLKGVSRSLSHELVRHRHLSFSQLSQRYVTEDPEFVVPPGLPEECLPQFESACSFAKTVYNDLLGRVPDAKRGREAARAVLPNACATRMVVTGNARSLRQMLSLRGSLAADAEFRRLAIKWTELMKKLSPNIFADFEIREEAGTQYVYTPYSKV